MLPKSLESSQINKFAEFEISNPTAWGFKKHKILKDTEILIS